MYGFLLSYLSPRWAGIVCAVWFAAIVALIVLLSVEPPADFRYGRY